MEKRSTRKELLQKLRDSGYDEEAMKFFERRPAKDLELRLENDATMETIKRVASMPRRN